MKECTFQPNLVSKKIKSMYSIKLHIEKEKPKADKEEVVKKLYEDAAKRSEKRQKDHEYHVIEKAIEEVRGCVFQPTVKTAM